MDINQVRILEACHKFLIGITSCKDTLQDDTLVYLYRGQRITFETYQEYSNLTFTDYSLQYSRLHGENSYINDRQELVDIFPSEEHLRALQRISDADQARIQIVKLLTQINLEVLSSKYSVLKKDNFGYDFYNFETKESYPIYLFSDNDNFELVAIS
ncbi:hypothetical protein HO964_09155 [Streptococcus suis]|nr:hypothetical protein [Streptococcus suis]